MWFDEQMCASVFNEFLTELVKNCYHLFLAHALGGDFRQKQTVDTGFKGPK